MRSPASGGRRAVCFGIAAAWTGVCAAQGSTKKTNIRRVGILALGQGPAVELEQMLRDLSTGGMQVAVEARFGTKWGALEEQAASLVANKVDLIFANGTPAAMVAQRVTTSIPIVYTIAADPVEVGLAATLSRPGGNATGVYTLSREVSGKRVSLLREAVPHAKRIGILHHPSHTGGELGSARAAAEAIGAAVVSLPVETKEAFARRFAEARSSGVDAISVLTDPILFGNLGLVADLALQKRMPTIAGYSNFADLGGTMSYAADPLDVLRSAIALVDKIFKGARPMDLPVQRSQRFVLILNLKTAASLGLSVPQTLRIQAERVIQ